MILFALLSFALSANAQRQDDWRKQYEQFKQERRREFQDFKAKANADFAAFLKQQWKNYTSQEADSAPIPVVMPRPQRLPAEKPDAEPLPETKPNLDAVQRIAENPSAPAESVGERLDVEFFGDPLRIPWSAGIAPRLASVDEAGFSAAWSAFGAGSDDAVRYLEDYAAKHRLNGWGYYQLVKKISERAYPADRPDERIAMQAYLLSQLKFRAQVAASGQRLVLLLPFREQVYSVPYLVIGPTKYYIYSYGHDRSAGYRTYENNFAYADRMLSLAMDGTMDVGMKMELEVPRWSALLGEKFITPMGVGNIALQLDYPIVDGEVYYRQGVSPKLAEKVLGTLRRKTAGMDEAATVGYLLNLVQNGFDYAIDEEVFGRQKQLFIEESFFYGQNNCKDRVGVFSWLVRELTGLDVIFVRYEGNADSGWVNHIACAVAFREEVAGDAFDYGGRRYVVCDPTYINAGIGRTMPCYASSKGKIEAFD